MRLFLIILAGVVLAAGVSSGSGCSFTFHDKQTHFEPGSIINAPDWTENARGFEVVTDANGKHLGIVPKAIPKEGAGATTSARNVTASGEDTKGDRESGAAGSGDVAARQGSGNILIQIGQNDGVEQESTADTSAAVQAQVSSPSSQQDATVTPKPPEPLAPEVGDLEKNAAMVSYKNEMDALLAKKNRTPEENIRLDEVRNKYLAEKALHK